MGEEDDLLTLWAKQSKRQDQCGCFSPATIRERQQFPHWSVKLKENVEVINLFKML